MREVIGTKAKDTELIFPNEWYYENSVIHPIWTGTDLVYRVSLVLTRHDTYTLYEFKALPHPTANDFVTQTLKVRQWYLEETMTGRYVHVSDCHGHSPVVCYGNLVMSKPSNCERALVRGNRKGIKDCALTLSKTTEHIQQLDVNQFGLTTNGESITTQCSTNPTWVRPIARGTYLITVNKDCTVEGAGWRLSGIAVVQDKVVIPRQRVQIANLSLENITINHVTKYVNDYKNIPDLNPVRTIKLEPLVEQDPVLNDSLFANYDSVTIADIVLLLLIVPPYLLCIHFVYVKCKARRTRASTQIKSEPSSLKADDKETSKLYPILPSATETFEKLKNLKMAGHKRSMNESMKVDDSVV